MVISLKDNLRKIYKRDIAINQKINDGFNYIKEFMLKRKKEHRK